MRVRPWWFTSAALVGCALFPSLEGLSGSTDASVEAAVEASIDAPPDVAKEAAPPDSSIACDGGLTACSGACLDTSSNASNCGACGHDCIGGGCLAGKCQPLILANAQNGAVDIAVGGGEVYWVNYNAGTVAKCSAAACSSTITVLASGRVKPNDMAIDATNVYWSEVGGVAYCARAGCGGTPTVLVSGVTAADGGVAGYDGIGVSSTTVFFPQNGSLRGCAISGCNNTPTTVTSAGADDLTTDATNLYGTTGSTIWKCPLASCSSSTRTSLVTGITGGESVAVDANNAYFTYGTNVGSCPLGGCTTPTVLASGQTAPGDIATDGVNVYWVDEVASTVSCCAVGGCNNAPEVLATGQLAPKGIAVDDKAVYWTQATGDAVVRLAK